MLRAICHKWWVVMLRGICAIALGIMTIAWPEMALLTLVLLFAIFTMADGFAALVLGFRGESDGTVWWTMVLMGVLAVAAGAVAFAWPGLTAMVLLVIIATSAIVRGLLEIVIAIRIRREIEDEWILALSGLMSVLFGVLMLLKPAAGALAIVLLIGAYMIALGVFAIALSLRLRRIGQKLPYASSP